MSGQPYKTPIDLTTTRQAYLSNLNLRAQIDDKNLQANKVYVKTGQLPVEPSDTRTTSEKLADIQRLKIDVASKLRDIADGENSQAIVNQLSPDQLQFLVQNFEPIKTQIKSMYSLGVLAPIFIEYLKKYIDKFNLTKGVELGLQQSTGAQLLANQQAIMTNMARPETLEGIRKEIENLGVKTSTLGYNIGNSLRYIEDFTTYFPAMMDRINRENNDIIRAQMLETLTGIVNELPTGPELQQHLVALQASIRARNLDGIREQLMKIEELLATGTDVSEQMTILMELARKSGSPLEPLAQVEEQGGARAEGKVAEQGDITEPEKQAILEKYRPSESLKNVEELKAYIGQLGPLLIADKEGVKINRLVNDKGQSFRSVSKWLDNIYGKKKELMDKRELTSAVRRINNLLKDLIGERAQALGTGVKTGRGIARTRPSQVLDTDMDYSKGLSEEQKFSPFGRFIINKRQLNKDVVAIKRPAGSTITSLPSTRVSSNLGKVLRKIVGGSVPTFDELNDLTDEEKQYLNKVATEARIKDKLNIPTPKKTDEEKEINEFEILKGQILAGNDNPEIVKKFKTLILKLSNKGLIPKVQVRELLLELTTLGH